MSKRRDTRPLVWPGIGVGRVFGLIGLTLAPDAAPNASATTTATTVAMCFMSASRDPDRLDVAELVNAMGGQLAAVPRLFHTAERQLGIRSRHTVDEHCAGLEVADEARLLVRILRPDV